MFTSITDLITLAIFLGISPQVKEGMTAYIRGDDKKDMTAFRNFLKQTANIQRDACVWMLESVLKTYKPDPQVSAGLPSKIRRTKSIFVFLGFPAMSAQSAIYGSKRRVLESRWLAR